MSILEVKITVKTVGTGRQKRHHPVCSPDPLAVHGADRKIHWKVQTKGWRFHLLSKDEPIQIKGRQRKEQFPSPPLFTADGRHGYLGDINSKVEQFSYTVHLIHESGARVSFDPRIDNQNGD